MIRGFVAKSLHCYFVYPNGIVGPSVCAAFVVADRIGRRGAAAERDENEARKAFTPSEAVAIARVIEDQVKAGALPPRQRPRI